MLEKRRRFIARSGSSLFDIFLIGGGGGGGRSASASWGSDQWAGAGGAGAYANFLRWVKLEKDVLYYVTIGQGGAGGTSGNIGGVYGAGGTGGTTRFGDYSAEGGGGAYLIVSAGGISNGSWGGAGGSGGGAADGHTPSSGVYEVLGSAGGSNGSDAPVSQHGINRGDGAGDGKPKYLFYDTALDLYCGGGGGGGRSAADSYAGGAGGGGAGGNPGGNATKYGGGGGGGAVAAGIPAGGSGYQGAVFIRKSEGTLRASDFSYSGSWRWYRDDPSYGIAEIYGNGIFVAGGSAAPTNRLMLYYNGNTFDDTTGGFERACYANYGDAGSVTFESSYIHVVHTCVSGTVNKIDLTGYTKLCIRANNASQYTNDAQVVIYPNKTQRSGYVTYGSDALEVGHLPSGTNLTELDISGYTGSYYIGVGHQAYAQPVYTDIYEIYLE